MHCHVDHALKSAYAACIYVALPPPLPTHTHAHAHAHAHTQWLQLQLWQRHKLRTLRRTLAQIASTGTLDAQGNLSVPGSMEGPDDLRPAQGAALLPVSVVYFRCAVHLLHASIFRILLHPLDDDNDDDLSTRCKMHFCAAYREPGDVGTLIFPSIHFLSSFCSFFCNAAGLATCPPTTPAKRNGWRAASLSGPMQQSAPQWLTS